jgi:hypothetical protein
MANFGNIGAGARAPRLKSSVAAGILLIIADSIIAAATISLRL